MDVNTYTLIGKIYARVNRLDTEPQFERCRSWVVTQAASLNINVQFASAVCDMAIKARIEHLKTVEASKIPVVVDPNVVQEIRPAEGYGLPETYSTTPPPDPAQVYAKKPRAPRKKADKVKQPLANIV